MVHPNGKDDSTDTNANTAHLIQVYLHKTKIEEELWTDKNIENAVAFSKTYPGIFTIRWLFCTFFWQSWWILSFLLCRSSFSRSSFLEFWCRSNGGGVLLFSPLVALIVRFYLAGPPMASWCGFSHWQMGCLASFFLSSDWVRFLIVMGMVWWSCLTWCWSPRYFSWWMALVSWILLSPGLGRQ